MRKLARRSFEAFVRVCLRVAPASVLKLYSYNPLFDAEYYLERYADVAMSDNNPWRHFRTHGSAEGRMPNPLFDTAWYRKTYPDTAATRLIPLDHFYFFGAREGRDPSPRFSTKFYIESNPDVSRAGLNPLLHYLRSGASEGRRSSQSSASTIVPVSLEATPLSANRMLSIASYLRIRALAASLKRSPAGRPLALVIAGGYPRPDQDAGSVLMLNVLRLMRDLGLEVLFVPTNSTSATRRDRRLLKELGVRVAPHLGRAAIPTILERIGPRLDLCWLSRYDGGGHYLDVVRRHAPNARVVFDPVDLHWLRLSREATQSSDRVGMFRAMAVRERETYLVRMASVSVVVSRNEEELLRRTVPAANIVWMPIPHEVPGRVAGFDTRDGLAFIGNYLHRPNVDAVTYFLDEVWPRVLANSPAMKFHVVGPELPDSLAQRQDPGLVIVGHVPKLDAWLNGVRLTVAPLRFGAGAKGKVIMSLANGLPCVATTIAAEGLELTGEESAIADDADEMAAAIVRIHHDKAAWLAMSDAAVRWAASTHSLEAARERLEAILSPIARSNVATRRNAATRGVAA